MRQLLIETNGLEIVVKRCEFTPLELYAVLLKMGQAVESAPTSLYPDGKVPSFCEQGQPAQEITGTSPAPGDSSS